MIKINEAYGVYGYDPSTDEFLFDDKVNDPGKVIERWFKENQKNPTCIAITADTEVNAKKLLQWALDHQDKIKQWHSQYKCHYKLDYMLNEINKKLSGNYGKIISWSGDQVHPFDLG